MEYVDRVPVQDPVQADEPGRTDLAALTEGVRLQPQLPAPAKERGIIRRSQLHRVTSLLEAGDQSKELLLTSTPDVFGVNE